MEIVLKGREIDPEVAEEPGMKSWKARISNVDTHVPSSIPNVV